MSFAAIYFTAVILVFLSMITGFLIWRFRYVIWSGWFRAYILCEAGELHIFTWRLKDSATDFTKQIHGIRGTYNIIQTETPDDKKAKVDESLKESEIPNSYVNKRFMKVYRHGKQRMPVAFYNEGQSEPIDMQNFRKYSVVSATRHRELARNTVTSQLLNAFNESSMKETVALLLGVGIVLCGLLILGMFLNSKIDAIAKTLGG